MWPRWKRGSCGLFLAVLLLAGCGKNSSEVANLDTDQLSAIHEMYEMYLKRTKHPPTKQSDLRPVAREYPTAMHALQDGRYVLVLGVPEAAAANTVLAYEKDTPEKGGQVLLRDGTVVDMTPQQFQAAPKGPAK